MIIREIDCLEDGRVFLYVLPQYLGWLVLFFGQLTVFGLFWCSNPEKLEKKVEEELNGKLRFFSNLTLKSGL